MPKAITRTTLNTILVGLDAGNSYAQIQKAAHVSHGTVSNIRRKHRPDLKVSVGGRPRKLSPSAVRYAIRLVTHNNCVSAVKATSTLCKLNGESINPQTVRRALKEAGLRAVKGAKKPKQTTKAKRERMAFADAHVLKAVKGWRRV